MTTHLGSCHCKAIKFQVDVDLATATRCNCTICTKIAKTGVIVKPAAFKLLTPEGDLARYGKSAAGTYFFCKTCGVHAFGRGHLDMLGGDYVSVNVNCLDDVDVAKVGVKYWDGRHDNWMAGPRETPWPMYAEG